MHPLRTFFRSFDGSLRSISPGARFDVSSIPLEIEPVVDLSRHSDGGGLAPSQATESLRTYNDRICPGLCVGVSDLSTVCGYAVTEIPIISSCGKFDRIGRSRKAR